MVSLLFSFASSFCAPFLLCLLFHSLNPVERLCVEPPDNGCFLTRWRHCWLRDRRRHDLFPRKIHLLGKLDGRAPLRKILLILGKGRKDGLTTSALVVDINGFRATPAHDLAAKGFSFAQIRLGVKMISAKPTFQFEPDEILCDEQMSEIVGRKRHRTLA